jgi:dipeptidyl aminopeptidase/acylaminoacyl peptidase
MMENFDPKPKRKNDEKRKGHSRRPLLFLTVVTALALIAAGIFLAQPRVQLMTDAPKYELLYRYGIPAATYRVNFQTGERKVVDIDGTVKQQDQYFSAIQVRPQIPWRGPQLKEYDTEASLSPDGTQVVYMSAPNGGAPRVYVLDLATGESRLVTPNYEGRNPQWSPDGKWIAFEAYHHASPNDLMVNDVDVYIVRADGAFVQYVSGGPTPMETLLGWERPE